MKTKIQKSVLALAVASFASQAVDTVQSGVLAVAVASFASHSTTGADGENVVLYDIPVLPAGSGSAPVDNRFQGGRVLHDNAAIAAVFNAKGRKAPIDIGHGTEWDGSAPAVGWVLELYVAEDTSLWAKCELNAEGRALIDGKKFGFTSPTMRGVGTETGDWVATSLKSLALTNNPALEMAASFTAGPTDVGTADTTPAAAETPTAAEAVEADIPATGDALAPAEQAPADVPAEASTEAAEVPAHGAAEIHSADAAATFAALQGTTVTLTTERDAALAQVVTLTAQLTSYTAQVTSLTAERDAARSELTAFTAKADSDAIQAAIDAANIAGRAYPFEREMLTTFGATQGLAKLQSYLSARPAETAGAFTTQTPDDGVPGDVQDYLTRMGLPIAAFVLGRG